MAAVGLMGQVFPLYLSSATSQASSMPLSVAPRCCRLTRCYRRLSMGLDQLLPNHVVDRPRPAARSPSHCQLSVRAVQRAPDSDKLTLAFCSLLALLGIFIVTTCIWPLSRCASAEHRVAASLVFRSESKGTFFCSSSWDRPHAPSILNR